jgi:hypothetical protein
MGPRMLRLIGQCSPQNPNVPTRGARSIAADPLTI